MGENGGVDFNTVPPTPFTSAINSIETCASISDKTTGKLLFYTDGATIWDANHNVMQNGENIGQDKPPHTSIQGAVIVPFINNNTKYYVFSIPVLVPYSGQLLYSVVDMTLNNGAGAVVAGSKRIKIADSMSEAMIVMQGCGMVWLVTQNSKTANFHAFRITEDGVNPNPVIPPLNYSKRPSSQVGIRASPDYKKIISIGQFFANLDGEPFLAIQDFDATNGRITNGQLIDTNENAVYYGCEFSQNGQRLYISDGAYVYQYNMALGTPDAIAASKTRLTQSTTGILFNRQRRSDGNIYVVRYDSDYLNMISNADALAPGCILTDKAVKIGGKATTNLPQMIVYPKEPQQGSSTTTSYSLCNKTSVEFNTTLGSALWQDGSNNNYYLTQQAGIYWVRGYNDDCKIMTDTFIVENCKLFFPSAFSPNGDGLNDIARMTGDVTELSGFQLSIYNRWGEQVFVTANPLHGWNGMQGASLSDVGVYFYQIQYTLNNEKQFMKGDLTLIR